MSKLLKTAILLGGIGVAIGLIGLVIGFFSSELMWLMVAIMWGFCVTGIALAMIVIVASARRLL